VLQVRSLGVDLELDGATVASTPDCRDEQARDEALASLREALDQLAAQD
jgi:tryptophanyl-tRNA synthetase